ncbi:MAG: ATP-binding cassette domain-containing protein [Pseudobacteriovorax sp.]|nr:ATP-binding cassette domain-containing protein [Pseudobacteriovorax sp.]
MIEVRQLSFSYGTKRILDIDALEIPTGKIVLIRGPSGSGKTTLLMLLRGILQPSSGAIHVLGHDLTAMNDRQRRTLRLKEIGSIFQQPALLPYLTVKENLCINQFLGDKSFPDPTDHTLVDELGVKPLLKRYPSELSGGEIQRVSLIRPFIHRPKLIIADEPTNHLDSDHRAYFVNLLKDYQNEYNTSLIVSHDESLIPHCDLVLNFKEISP